MAIIRVDYNEFNQSSYRKMELELDTVDKGARVKIDFNSGNFVVDNYRLTITIINLSQEGKWSHGVYSSSYDHFFMDGNQYRERYFDPETGEFVNEENGGWDYYEKYPRVVCLTRHKNFDQVKAYVKRKEKELGLEPLIVKK